MILKSDKNLKYINIAIKRKIVWFIIRKKCLCVSNVKLSPKFPLTFKDRNIGILFRYKN